MKIVLLLLLFAGAVLHADAQQIKYDQKAKHITEFPFTQLIGGVILVQAYFDSIKQPLNFILDTGSGGISLDSTTALEFKIENVPSGRTVHGIAGIRPVNVAKNRSLQLPGLKVDSLDFYINNYEILSSVYGLRIDGIIGYSFLKQFIVKIDFDKKTMEVLEPGNIRYPRGGMTLHPIFTALPIQTLTIEDARRLQANFYIDTGAGLCLLLTKNFLRDSSFLLQNRKPVSIQVQGLGGKKAMLVTISKQVKIGRYVFKKVPTNLLDDENNVISYPFLAGLIGNDLLRRFNLVINYPQKEIHLRPNTHYKDEFDYSYTGFNLYWIDGSIAVHDIVENSPATDAGLQEGDILIGVNTDFSNNITKYKNSLSKVNERVFLIIQRKGEVMSLKLKVGRIY